MRATAPIHRPIPFGPWPPILAVAAIVLVVFVSMIVWPLTIRKPVDTARSSQAKTFFDGKLNGPWAWIPDARNTFVGIEIRGDEMLVLTSAPREGDQRKVAAPLCFVSMDYVELPGSGVRVFRVVASDGTPFLFHPKVPCLMLGY